MNLTPDQQIGLDNILGFLDLPIRQDDTSTYLFTLSGYAGTGKTTLSKEIIKTARKKGLQVLVVAPTHKARKVLDNILNKSAYIRIATTTIAGLLMKQKAHSYIGTHHYEDTGSHKVNMYDLFIIDEISMITTTDYNKICSLVSQCHKKVIFIGDEAQIPHPTQNLVLSKDGTFLFKAPSPAFDITNIYRLTQIIRQTDTPLLKLYTELRNSLGKDYTITDLLKIADIPHNNVTNNKGYIYYDHIDDFTDMLEKICVEKPDLFKEGTCRVVSYTNNSIKLYNNLIRSIFIKDTPRPRFIIGELLMGYVNIGKPNDLTVENGQDYSVKEILGETRTIISCGKQFSIKGEVLTVLRIGVTGSKIKLFFPYSNGNDELLEELLRLSSIVNKKGSTKLDYIQYMILKSQVFYIENIYKYETELPCTETELHLKHPLLFTNVNDVLDKEGIIKNKTSAEILSRYPDILQTRIEDNKAISDNEKLSDCYQILEKDIDYGYAITTHKSQGSTYNTVFADTTNYNLLKDGTNDKGIFINRALERDQLKYVALTRPTNIAYIV